MTDDLETKVVRCPDCGHALIPPQPEGQPGDDSYYCDGCGQPWSLDLKRRLL